MVQPDLGIMRSTGIWNHCVR